MKIKPLVEINNIILIREDCANDDCFDPNCDICHIHSMPADEYGLCEDCEE